MRFWKKIHEISNMGFVWTPHRKSNKSEWKCLFSRYYVLISYMDNYIHRKSICVILAYTKKCRRESMTCTRYSAKLKKRKWSLIRKTLVLHGDIRSRPACVFIIKKSRSLFCTRVRTYYASPKDLNSSRMKSYYLRMYIIKIRIIVSLAVDYNK
jgi:hypothetical protein